MKKKNFIAPEVLVHEMRKGFTDIVCGVSGTTEKESTENPAAPQRQNADFPQAPQDQSGMMESPWD